MNFRIFIFCTLLCIYLVEVTLKSEALGQSQTSQLETAITYYNLGVEKLELGDYESAITELDEAIAIYPQYANAYHNRGLAKIGLGDNEGAIADFDRVIEINPEYPQVRLNRGLAVIRFNLDKYKESIFDFLKFW